MRSCSLRDRSSALSGCARLRVFEWIQSKVVEFVLVRRRPGYCDHFLSPAETLVALAGYSPELRVVVIARELDEMLPAIDINLGDHCLDVVSGS